MVLNYIWIAFFLIAFVTALMRLVFLGDTQVFPEIINSTFNSSKTAFEISLGLTGVLSLWLGIMRIGEQGGVITLFSRLLGPLFSKLFPDIPKGHPVTGSIFMNLAANMLGLDNAATPLGLKAMEGLQELNPKKDTASNPMIMFLVLNTSGLTLIPISIMVYRAQLGATQPTDIFVPILLATFFSTLAGIVAVSIYQRINLFNRTILLFLGGMSLLVAGIIYFFNTLSRDQIDIYSTGTRVDGRCHDHIRSRFLCRPTVLYLPRLHRHHLLYSGGIFRQRRNSKDTPRRSLRTASRCGRGHCSYSYLLSFLRLKYFPYLCTL